MSPFFLRPGRAPYLLLHSFPQRWASTFRVRSKQTHLRQQVHRSRPLQFFPDYPPLGLLLLLSRHRLPLLSQMQILYLLLPLIEVLFPSLHLSTHQLPFPLTSSEVLQLDQDLEVDLGRGRKKGNWERVGADQEAGVVSEK